MKNALALTLALFSFQWQAAIGGPGDPPEIVYAESGHNCADPATGAVYNSEAGFIFDMNWTPCSGSGGGRLLANFNDSNLFSVPLETWQRQYTTPLGSAPGVYEFRIQTMAGESAGYQESVFRVRVYEAVPISITEWAGLGVTHEIADLQALLFIQNRDSFPFDIKISLDNVSKILGNGMSSIGFDLPNYGLHDFEFSGPSLELFTISVSAPEPVVANPSEIPWLNLGQASNAGDFTSILWAAREDQGYELSVKMGTGIGVVTRYEWVPARNPGGDMIHKIALPDGIGGQVLVQREDGIVPRASVLLGAKNNPSITQTTGMPVGRSYQFMQNADLATAIALYNPGSAAVMATVTQGDAAQTIRIGREESTTMVLPNENTIVTVTSNVAAIAYGFANGICGSTSMTYPNLYQPSF